jgi:Domain of unknown function (DUF4157)
MDQGSKTNPKSVGEESADELPRVPMESLAQLLGVQFYVLSQTLKNSHDILPSTPKSALAFWQKRRNALTRRSTSENKSGPEYNADHTQTDSTSSLARELARFPSSTLDGEQRQTLSRQLGLTLPVVRIHHHHYAQQIAKQMRADALSVGTHILLRSPQSTQGPSGAALLGHELTHAAQEFSRPQSRPSTMAEERVREIKAVTHERRLLNTVLNNKRGQSSAYQASTSSMAAVPASSSLSHAVSKTPIRAAARGRDLTGPSNSTNAAPSAGLDAAQLSHIQDNIYRELMVRIREDFERGY